MKDSDQAPRHGQAPGLNPESEPDPIPASIMTQWIHPAVLLVATDLSDLDRLAPFAFEQATQTGARLLFLHVVSASASYSADMAGMPYYDPAGALQYAARELEPVCQMARQLNIPCQALLREGSPADQIGAAARQFKADRLLLGTRSRSKLGKLLLGSVAEQVLRSVNLPVITVGPEAHLPVDASHGEPVVLLATTLRETSRPSAALACQIAACQGARLVLLHVLQPAAHRYNVMPLPFLPPLNIPAPSEFFVEEPDRGSQSAGFDSLVLQELCDLAAEAGAAHGVEVEPHVVHGNPCIEILAQASERHASLIVLGARSHSLFENLTRDRTIYRVLAHARCPVLTLREAETSRGAQKTASLTTHG
ncbi:MAG: universal stress protein [Terracidiphilus sp.]|jgi:nucleotide-binding universal stress UspA family protein